MYAYVMRPETLPPPYFQFIVSTGPIQLPVLDAVKANHRGQAINMQALKDVYEKFAPKATVAAAPLEIILKTLSENAYGKGASPLYPPLLPCSIMHPQNPHCSSQWLETFLNGAKRSLPIYLSLTFVPMFILRFWAVIKHPVEQLQRGLWSVTRSTSFLSSFVATYMMIVCWQRKLVVRDHRSLYWVAGFIASWTILLEQKSRRSELALYVLPRTIDSLVQTMQSRQMLAEVPHGEKMLFMTGMGALMYFRTFHPETMSPFLKRVLNFLVPSSASMPKDAGATASTVAAHHEKHLTSAPSSSASTTEPRMQRKDSDGLSAASINGTIPLPSAGISFAREQSFPSQPLAALVAGGASSSSLHMIRGSPPPHSSSSSDASITSGLVARDLSPTGEELAVPSLSSTPEVSLFSPTSRSDLAPSLSSSPDQEQEETARSARGGSCVGEKVDSIETRINSERPESGGLQEELAQELNKQQQQQQQHSSNGNGKKKKRSNH
jgi:hypothetical protein